MISLEFLNTYKFRKTTDSIKRMRIEKQKQ